MSRAGTVVAVALFGLLLGTPYLMRPPEEKRPADAVSVIALSPQPEEVRYEFGRGFREWHAEQYPDDPPVVIEWRNVGGTSDIVRFIRSEFGASPDGIGVDLFFGGGDFESRQLAKAGLLAPVKLPDDLACAVSADLAEGRPWRLSGNDLAAPAEPGGGRRWYGTCLSAFGIVYSPAWHTARGAAPPRTWADLARPEYRGWVGAADPSKSGSAMKCFEMILQERIAAAEVRLRGSDGRLSAEAAAAAQQQGWLEGMALIARIGANSRYLSDQAPKVCLDVSLGETAAGMTIDFYGRYQQVVIGGDRIAYAAPEGGTSLSADPVSVLRGAPNARYAERFVAFCLSRRGQMIWALPPRTGPHAVQTFPDGRPIPADLPRPWKHALQRTPVRPDVYADPDFVALGGAGPGGNPFAAGETLLRYEDRRTGAMFSLLKNLYLPAMLTDARDEMQAAWDALAAAGFPAEATAEFARPPLSWADLAAAGAEIKASPRPSEAAFRKRSEWAGIFQEKYARIARTAK